MEPHATTYWILDGPGGSRVTKWEFWDHLEGRKALEAWAMVIALQTTGAATPEARPRTDLYSVRLRRPVDPARTFPGQGLRAGDVLVLLVEPDIDHLLEYLEAAAGRLPTSIPDDLPVDDQWHPLEEILMATEARRNAGGIHITAGGDVTVSGVISERIDNSIVQVDASPAPDDVKELIHALEQAVKHLVDSGQVKGEDAAALQTNVADIAVEAAQEPDKRLRYRLKRAFDEVVAYATKIGEAGTPLVAVAKQLMELLS